MTKRKPKPSRETPPAPVPPPGPAPVEPGKSAAQRDAPVPSTWQRRRRRLEVEDIGNITVVNFVDKKILDEQNIMMIGDDLFSLVDELGRFNIIVNFGNVEYLSSVALGKFITLAKKAQGAGGSLVMCGIAKEIYEVFKITKLDKMFSIVDDEQSALELFRGATFHLSCPVAACAAGPLKATISIRRNDVVSLSETCSQCGAEFRVYGSIPSEGEAKPLAVLKYSTPTYDNAAIEVDVQAHYWSSKPQKSARIPTLKVPARLDLFAAESLEMAWRTVPKPALLDLRGVTELSARAGAVVLNLIKGLDPATSGSILIDPAKPDQATLVGKPNVFTDKAEAWLPLADLASNARPLTVSVKRIA